MKTYTVYQLTVERVPGIYIGITCMRLSQRLASHKADIKHRKNNARVNWLRQAQEHGHDIHIRPILTGLTKQDAEQLEEELIALAPSRDWDIKNTNPGGRPNWHSAHSPAAREKARLAIRQAHSQDWLVTSPLGVTFQVTNMKQFCRDNHLDPGTMSQVASGKQDNHKGWSCRRLGWGADLSAA